MSAPDWNELKADGRVVFDFPKRKMAIYPNPGGGVILLTVDDGKSNYFDIYQGDFAATLELLHLAMREAKTIDDGIQADYVTHQIIEKARGT